MKILFYISVINAGGAARVMTNLANAFVDQVEGTHEVFFLTNIRYENEYTLSSYVKRETVDNGMSKGPAITRTIRRCVALRRLIKNLKPDLVVSFMSDNDVRAYFATRGLNVKLIMSVRNDPNVLFQGRVARMFFTRLYNRADGVVFQTEEARAWFGNKFKPLTRVIFNQVAENFYCVERSETPENIVALGKFLPKKNHRLLIEAFTKIKDQIEDDLYIYGGGALEADYKEMIRYLEIENRVHIEEFSSQPEMILKSAKIFVLSSDYEGMPNVLLEAMAAGVPCVSTDCPCGGPHAVIRNGENGMLVPVKDENRMAEAILKLVKDKEFREKIGRNGKETANLFYPKKVQDDWKDFFYEVIEG